MSTHIEIPEVVPVMTLSNVVLFPQVVMPLFIFEPRYKKMLRDILTQERIFALAMLDERTEAATTSEMPYCTAGVGIIRVCKENADGNSNLVIQGIARVQFETIVSDDPYRKAFVKRLQTKQGGSKSEITKAKERTIGLINTKCRLGESIPLEVLRYLTSIEDPQELLDTAIHTFCTSAEFKQKLLETINLASRYELFTHFLESEIQQIKLNIKLKGKLDDKNIGNN